MSPPLPIVNPIESSKTLLYRYQQCSQFNPVQVVMTHVEYIQIRLCSCIYLYMSCLCTTIFVPFVIEHSVYKRIKHFILSANQNYYLLKSLITMHLRQSLKSKTSKLNSSKEFLIPLRRSVTFCQFRVLSLSTYTTFFLKQLHKIVKSKLTQEFLIPLH